MTFKEQIFLAMPVYSPASSFNSPASLITSELWQRLRQARKYADLTQADLAKACGVTRGAVALWEAAEVEHRTKPTTDHLIQIAKKTKVPLEWLLNDAASTDQLWKLAGEFGGGGVSDVLPETEPEVLPDLRQGDYLFVFAKTPTQISAKLEILAAEPETTRKHLVLVGVGADVLSVSSPTEALSAVVQLLSK